MATAFSKFHEFVGNVGLARINLNTDTFKAVLTNSAPSAANDDELTDITQIANGSGYTTGGVTLANVAWAETGAGTGIWKFTCDDFSWTASGGSIGPFQYVVIYSDTSSGDKLVCYNNYGAALTITDGNSFTVDINASNGILQVS